MSECFLRTSAKGPIAEEADLESAQVAMLASVTGPWKSIPFFALRRNPCRVMLLYGVSAGLPPDGVRKGKGRSHLIGRGCRACARRHRADVRPDPIHRPGKGRRFCNGPSAVNPFFAPYPLPGSCFCTGSALGCRLMVSEKEGAGPISYGGVAGLAPSTTERKCGLTQSIVPAGTPLRAGGVILPENRRMLLLSRRSGLRNVSLSG